MKKVVLKYLFSWWLLITTLFCMPLMAKAGEEHNLSLVGVKCPMDNYASETGDDKYYACMDDYLAGDLDTYVVGEGDNVDPGTVIMFALHYVPGATKSVVALNTTLTYDANTWTSIHESTSDFYDDSIFPKSGRKTGWTVEMNKESDGKIIILASDLTNYKPLEEEMDLYYVFLELNSDVTPGKTVSLNFGTDNGDTMLSDENTGKVAYSTTDLNLSVYGSQSADASLKTLTVSNGSTKYPLSPTFTPGDTTNVSYSVVVPNNITSIELNAEANHEYATIASASLGTKALNIGNNEFEIVITSQIGYVETYKVNVYRLSNDATLKRLTLTNNVNIETLTSGMYAYTANNVPYATKNTTISATPTNENAFIDSGTGLWTFTNSGATPNIQTIVVKAENCLEIYETVEGNSCTSQNYTITVNRVAASTNNYLSSLTVDGTSVPSFNRETDTYELSPVSNATVALNIQAIVEDTGKATIKSGTGTVNLHVGDNTFDVVVEAENGDEKTYTIKVRRLSNDTTLKELNVTSNPLGNLTPTFSSSFTGEYKYIYDPTVSTITVSATVVDTNKASVFIADVSNGNEPTGTPVLNSTQETFSVTTTNVSVVVTAEDGTIKVYKVALERQKESNNYLKSLSLSDGELSPNFSATTRVYTASVDGSVENVEVYAEKAGNYSQITSISGNTNLNFGVNQIEIVVKAENGDTASYLINLTRKKYNIATLDDLTVNGTTVDNFVARDETKLEYTISNVPYETTSLVISGVKTNEYSTVSGFKTVDLTTGDNIIRVEVKSHDESKTNTYIINVYREKNPDNTVHGITVAGQVPTIDDSGNYVVTLPNDKTVLNPSDVVISTGDGAQVVKDSALTLTTKQVNTYGFSVTSEKGETEYYNILITRTKSNDTSISKVVLSLGSDNSRYCLMEGNSCTIGVPVETTEFSLSALIHSEATISPENGTNYTMSASESIKTITLTVTAEDGTTKNYDVVVERQKSSNNNLSDLQIDGITVDNFKAETQIYYVSVPGLTTEIQVGATVQDTGKATIETDLSNKFALNFGQNQIDVKVKSEDGNIKTYTLMVTRLNGVDATLKDLKINGTTVTNFKPETTEYLLNDVDYNTTSLNILAVPNDDLATVNVSGLVDLKTGYNEIVITVTAHDTSVTKVYTIKVTRDKNSDIGIQSISLANIVASKNETTGKYEVTVPNNVTKANSENTIVVVNDPKTNYDAKATYLVDEKELSTEGATEVPITITAEDGTIKIYYLVVTREKSSIALLDTLTITNGSFNPSFNSNTFEYSVTVPVDTTEFDVSATKVDDKSVITQGTGHYQLTDSTKQIEVVVVSEDTKVSNSYILNITRIASSINTLSSITVDNGVLTPEFDKDTTDYTVNVDGSVTEITVDATLTDERGKIISGLGKHDLVVGENIITIKVESESGAPNSYTIKVNRAKKSDNSLSTLTVDGVEVPDFNPETLEYTLSDVVYSKTSILIGATTTDSDATIEGTGNKGLKTGENTFEVIVTAQNGDTRTYKINIKREKNNNAYLSILSVKGTTLDPKFNKETTEYTVTVAETKDKLSPSDVTAVTEDNNAKVVKQNEITLSTTTDNYYTVTVTAEDGTLKVYTIQVIRPKSTDATLKEVKLNGAIISPTFKSTTYEYTLTVPYGSTSGFTIEGIPNVETTQVTNNGTYYMSDSPVEIITQAENGNTLTYTFTIVEAASNDATLSSLEVSGYNLDKTFQSTTLNYDIGNIPYSTTQLRIDAVASNANATIEYYVDGSLQSSNIVSIPQTLGEKTIKVRVIAADKVTVKDYNITYNVVNSSNAYLYSIVPSVGDLDFNKTTFNYNNFVVDNSVTSVDFIITTEDENASIKVNEQSFFTPKTITVSDLQVGTQTLEILVTAQDGVTTETYTIVIRRQNKALSDDAYLSSLSVDGYDLDKAFAMETYEYSIGELPFNLTTLTINAIPNYGSSTITYSVNGIGQSSNVVTIPKVEGTGAINIKVIAEDGKTVKNYKITYSKQASTNAYLSNIIVSPGTMDKAFNKETSSYTVSIDRTVTNVDITVQTEDTRAGMTINGTSYSSPHTLTLTNLAAGNTEVIILVTAENGNVLTYKVTINKEADPASTITSVDYGHEIVNGYIKTVKLNTTGLEMKNQLDNANEYLEVWNADEKSKVNDNETLATGMIVKLIIDGKEKDRKLIVIKGDTSGDGEIDLFDAVGILNHYLDRTPLTSAYKEAAYVNDDNDIDLFDSVMILNHYLGKISLH